MSLMLHDCSAATDERWEESNSQGKIMNRGINAAILLVAMTVLILGMASSETRAESESSDAHATSNSALKGRYICRVTTDDGGESAVVVLELDGKGGFTSSNKILISRDFTSASCGTGNNDACACVQNLTSSSYTVSSTGAFTATLMWMPKKATNPSACDSTTTFDDTWVGAVSSAGKTVLFASTNDGDETDNGPGTCIKAP